MNPRHFLKMAQWVRNPPSRQRQILVAVVIGLCVLVYGIDFAQRNRDLPYIGTVRFT